MYGGNPTITDLKLVTLSSSHTSTLFPPKETSHRPISFATAVVLLFKAACSTDSLTFISSFEIGIFVALGSCLFMLFFTQASFYVFTRTWSFGEAYSYADVWKLVFGPKLVLIPEILLIIAYLSCLICGFWEITAYIPDILLSVWPETPAILQSEWFLQYICAIPILLPCFFFPKLSSFHWICWICLICFIVSLLCMIVYFFRTQWDDGYISASQVVLAKWEWEGVYQVLSDYNIAFFSHSFVAPIAQEMKQPSRQRTIAMTWVTFAVAAFFSYLMPLFGYLFFIDVPYSENVMYFLNPVYPEAIIGKIAVLGISLSSTAFFTYHLAESTARIIMPETVLSPWSRLWSGLGLTLPVICIVILGDVACDLSYEISGIALTFIGFVLPPLYYLVQFRYRFLKWGIIVTIVLVLGLALLVLSLIFTIQGHLEE
jgi:hypothetical protein